MIPVLYNSDPNQERKLNTIIGFDEYQQLFNPYPETNYWNQLWQIINHTKGYEQGIELSIILQQKFELYKDKFDNRQQETQIALIYQQFLQMLDKADLWEFYLKNWEIIKQKSIEFKLGNEYEERSRQIHFSRGGEEYFIGNTERGYKLSFMYGTDKRRDLIQRKLEKAKKGGKIGNYIHKQRSDYTEEEIHKRYEWMINYFRTGQFDW